MNCREFQKKIPEIIENKIPDEELESVIEHVEKCKDCYDELEIYYVLQYGLNDSDNKQSMNFVGRLDNKIKKMKGHLNHYEVANAFYNGIYVVGNTAIFAALIYTIFYII